MHHITESIAQNPELDMPWLFDLTFDIETTIAEVSLPLTARLSDCILQQIEIANNSHSLATAASGGLGAPLRGAMEIITSSTEARSSSPMDLSPTSSWSTPRPIALKARRAFPPSSSKRAFPDSRSHRN